MRLLPILAFALFAQPATAAVTVTFYSRDTGAVLEHFPHGYFGVKGVMDAGGPAIDTNYGFTAKAVSPAILWGSVGGEIVTMSPAYVAKSDAHISFTLSDAEYERLIAVVEKWKALPAPSYNLKRRNCVFFVADAARTLGLDAYDDPKLMLKPRSFLEGVTARNKDWLAARALTAPREAATGLVHAPAGEKKNDLGSERRAD